MRNSSVTSQPVRPLRLVASISAILVFVVTTGLQAGGNSEIYRVRLEYASDPGEVSARDAEGAVIEPVRVGTELPVGAVVTTGETSAELSIGPGHAVVRMDHETSLAIEDLARLLRGRTALRLGEGTIRSVVRELLGAQEFEVSAPRSVSGVRGTDFRVEVVPGEREVITVFEGEVEVRRRDGATRTLGAGESIDAVRADFDPRTLSDEERDELDSESDFEAVEPEDLEEARGADGDADDDDGDDGDGDDGDSDGSTGGGTTGGADSGGDSGGGDADGGDSDRDGGDGD